MSLPNASCKIQVHKYWPLLVCSQGAWQALLVEHRLDPQKPAAEKALGVFVKLRVYANRQAHGDICGQQCIQLSHGPQAMM